LKNKLGSLFNLEFDLLLYDVTSTYFEGQCHAKSGGSEYCSTELPQIRTCGHYRIRLLKILLATC